MTSAIKSLQLDCLPSDKPLVDIVRKAYFIANKLNLVEFEQWLGYELNGYPQDVELPQYRIINALLKYKQPYHGWQPLILGDTMVTGFPIGDSVVRLQSESDYYLMDYDPKRHVDLVKATGSEVCYFISKDQIVSLKNSVRTEILDWALKLEKEGILGENMCFTTEEKQKAKDTPSVTNIIHNYGTMQGTVGNSTHQTNHLTTGLDKETQTALLKEIQALSEEMKNEYTNKMEAELSKSKPDQANLLDWFKELVKIAPTLAQAAPMLCQWGQQALNHAQMLV